jgi:hypothetical protein
MAGDISKPIIPRKGSCPTIMWSERVSVTWDVRFGSLADICSAKGHVRFAPNSDRESGFRQKAIDKSAGMNTARTMRDTLTPGVEAFPQPVACNLERLACSLVGIRDAVIV